MRFSTTLAKFTTSDSKVFGLHLPVPNNIASKFIEGTHRRVICTINETCNLSSGLMPSSEYWYILINQKIKKQLQLEIGDSVVLDLEKDSSPYGMEMPAELEASLLQDELASKYFHELTSGKQRNLIYLVSKVKNTNSRINKALAIIDHLVEREGQLDFKLLNEKIKEYNQRGKLN